MQTRKGITRTPNATLLLYELCMEKYKARATPVCNAEGERLKSIQSQKIPSLAKITRKVPIVLLKRKM